MISPSPSPRFALPSLALAMALASVSHLIAAETPKTLTFNRDIRPILSDNCFSCHGPDKGSRKSGLRLDDPEQPFQKAKSGAIAIVRGQPAASELITRILSEDPEEIMPTPKSHKKLTKAQKEILEKWVSQGAAYEPYWAYIAPQRPPVPASKTPELVRNPIDAFIQNTLASKSIAPSAQADRHTLLRRLSLDLIGLPPSPEELRAFEADSSPQAFETQIDRLLASPRYGERMAQQWLDVARYADTVGFHGDQNQNTWAFRDYVIDSFNSNKPFDQFTLEQLAGDLLPNPSVAQRVATCFNRLNMMTREGGAQSKEYLAKYTTDRIRAVGMAWLGSTLQCCECHDHKFDPFKTKDFYSLGAFFADVKQWGVYATYGSSPNPELAGFTNEYPFPPELVVSSPALVRRSQQLKGELEELSKTSHPEPQAFAQWQSQTQDFLRQNPTGWLSLPTTVQVATPTAKKGAPKPASSSPAPTDKPAPESPAFILGEDHRITFEAKPAATATLKLTAQEGSLAALKLELLPEPKYDGKVLRSASDLIKVELSLVCKTGKPQPLAIRHAEADHRAPRYSNGAEILGVETGWKINPEEAALPHSAIYFLQSPVTLAAGDTIQVRLIDNAASAVRVSVSPLAPGSLSELNFPADLAEKLHTPEIARAFYLRSTGSDEQTFARLKTLEANLLACREGKTPVLITEVSSTPLTIRVLPRGNWQDETGEVCQPATPHFLPALENSAGRKLTRLDLAKWLCAPENPLTARVVINRMWKQFFGTGLCAQADDFGAQGEPPSHPELLDWLAVEFREGGWDLKRMARLILSSHTYRQIGSLRPELHEIDPNNRLLASQNPRRLEAEAIRDNALAVAGLLNLEMGGPPCHPFQPPGYYAGLQFPDREYPSDQDQGRYRRSIYMHWQRTFLHPMLANFDAPSREDCIAMRNNSNSPQQALTLLNDPQFVDCARAFATQLLGAPAASDQQRLELAFQKTLARPAKESETQSLCGFLLKARKEFQAKPEDAAKLAALPASAAATELAAWTSLCRVVLNLHETITRY